MSAITKYVDWTKKNVGKKKMEKNEIKGGLANRTHLSWNYCLFFCFFFFTWIV